MTAPERYNTTQPRTSHETNKERAARLAESRQTIPRKTMNRYEKDTDNKKNNNQILERYL